MLDNFFIYFSAALQCQIKSYSKLLRIDWRMMWFLISILSMLSIQQFYLGGFHLYLLVFPFVYQFYSIIEALVSSSFANDEFRRISVSFQHHFKIYLLWLLHEKECSFYSYLFCCTEMTWMFIISTTIWVNGWDTSSVASRARSELTSSQCNWKGNRKGKGTDETPLNLMCKLL